MEILIRVFSVQCKLNHIEKLILVDHCDVMTGIMYIGYIYMNMGRIQNCCWCLV